MRRLPWGPAIRFMPSHGLLAVAALLLADCAHQDLSAPTAQFAEAMAQSSAAIEAVFTDEHSYAQGVYLERQAIDAKPISKKTLETGVGIISPAALQPRLHAIELVKAYATTLASIASSRAPSAALSATQALGSDLTTLAATFEKAGRANPTDSNASKYVGPVSTVVGWVTEQALDYERNKAMKAAVDQASPSVKTMLSLLQSDLILLRLQRQIDNTELLSALLNSYNRNATRLSWTERKALTAEIASDENAKLTSAHFAALDSVSAWGKANDALIVYLNSPQSSSDLASLVAAINAFSARVQPLLEAMSTIKQLR